MQMQGGYQGQGGASAQASYAAATQPKTVFVQLLTPKQMNASIAQQTFKEVAGQSSGGCGDCAGERGCCNKGNKTVSTAAEETAKPTAANAEIKLTDGMSSLYDSREAPVATKIEYGDSQRIKPTTMNFGQPYSGEPPKHISSQKTPTGQRETYVFGTASPKPAAGYSADAASTAKIAGIADKVAASYGAKGNAYAANGAGQKADSQTNHDAPLLSKLKAYATALGTAFTLAATSLSFASAPAASYTKLKQAVAGVKVQAVETAPKLSSLDAYVAPPTPMLRQSQPTLQQFSERQIISTKAGPIITAKPATLDAYVSNIAAPAVQKQIQAQPTHQNNQQEQGTTIAPKQARSLEHFTTLAYQTEPKTVVISPIQTAKANEQHPFYRLLPFLFTTSSSRDKSGGEKAEQDITKPDYAHPYSSEQRVYHTTLQDTANEAKEPATRKSTAIKKERTVLKKEGPLMDAEKEAKIASSSISRKKASQKAPKQAPAHIEPAREPSIARSISSERSLAELSIIRGSLSAFPIAQFGLNLGKSS